MTNVRMTKQMPRNRLGFRHSSFEHSSLIRHSNFVIRVFAALFVLVFLTTTARAAAPVFPPDIPYTTVDGVDLKLDVATPPGAGPQVAL